MNAPTLTRRGFTKGLGGIVLAFSLDPAELLAQGAAARLPGSRSGAPCASSSAGSSEKASARPPIALVKPRRVRVGAFMVTSSPSSCRRA